MRTPNIYELFVSFFRAPRWFLSWDTPSQSLINMAWFDLGDSVLGGSENTWAAEFVYGMEATYPIASIWANYYNS